jgi:hypothetical protein
MREETAGAGDAGPEAAYVQRLRSLIRQQAAHQGDQLRAAGVAPATPAVDWSMVVACLHQAEQHAGLPRRPARLGGPAAPFRLLVHGLARVVRYLARPLLVEQRTFNNAALGCLRAMQVELYQMEQRTRQLNQDLLRRRDLPD